MSNVTHEFRTPLSALEASTELLLDNLPNLSQAEIEELLISLNLGITNLQALIDNLIEAGSMEAGRFKVSLQPVPYKAILKDARDVNRTSCQKICSVSVFFACHRTHYHPGRQAEDGTGFCQFAVECHQT